MATTHDIGNMIYDAIYDKMGEVLQLLDWAAPEPFEAPLEKVVVFDVDASHNFSNLIVETTDGSKFRVAITKED